MAHSIGGQACTWPVADPRVLPGDALHIWCTSLDAPLPVLDLVAATLTPDELTRADAYRQPRDRRRFVAARGALRSLLAAYLAVSPHDLRFKTGAYGKPLLAGENPLGLNFNVSHAHELALFAVRTGGEVGIDIEYGRAIREADAIAAHFFSPGERAELAALPPGERTAAFYACWTRKEAYIKLVGKGLAQALDDFQVTLDPALARLVWVKDAPGMPDAVSMHNLSLPDPYFGAVATLGAMPEVICSLWASES